MPVAVILDFPGGTIEQYDQVVEKMGFAAGGPGAPGGIFHWVTATDTGIRVTDVWRSREDFDAFTQAKTNPIVAEVGIPGPPEITFHDVHNYLTAGPEA
ncbi:hypothetical protein [Arthrobacter sp. ISL-5]|uniref:hypothetical protein n=1 Tax=Arthrobacter sp. ISL-5 TaxID=2819111 RepID=UPI001BE85D29|nr:hypothetical protein [Arthrobacter sp. ISL-5]MBT2554411.1 hypothetical protein [Arthrobacter sp. ISL-5]